MNTIVRASVAARYTAPENVPAYDRRWDRAMADLNVADDTSGLAVAVALDAKDITGDHNATLNHFDLGKHHAAVSALNRDRAERIAPPRLAPVTDSIVTNGPNTEPASAVGLLLAS